MKLVEPYAVKLGFKIEERSWNKLIANPHEKSEWVTLHWHKIKTIKNRTGWDMDKINQKAIDLDDDTWFCSGFVKTQYAGTLTHIKVAEFLRRVAAFCSYVEIFDEADYYESGATEKSLKETNESFEASKQMIEGLGEQLKNLFGKDNVIMGGSK